MNRYLTLGDKNNEVIVAVDTRLISGQQFTAWEIMNELNTQYQLQWGGGVKPFGENETRELVHNYMATYHNANTSNMYTVPGKPGATAYIIWYQNWIDYPTGRARTYQPAAINQGNVVQRDTPLVPDLKTTDAIRTQMAADANTLALLEQTIPTDKSELAYQMYVRLADSGKVPSDLQQAVRTQVGNLVLKWLNS